MQSSRFCLGLSNGIFEHFFLIATAQTVYFCFPLVNTGGIMTAVSTEDDNVYHIRPIRGDRKGEEVTLTFDVKCRNDAHVALLSSSSVDHPMIEVFIGGWRNQKSAIRFNQTKPDKAIVETPDIVSEEEYRRFWIRVNSCSVRVGCEGDTEPFLSWDEREDPFRVTHFGFATGWGSTGSWYLEEEDSSSSSSSSSSEDEDSIKIRQRGRKPFFKRPGVWMKAKDGHVPLRAVIGGSDTTGEKIYVGRVKHDGALLPGKVVPSHKTCYVAADGIEQGSAKYQVLVRNKFCDLVWVPANDGSIPLGALQGGFTKDKDPVFIGRIFHDGTTIIGMVLPNLGVCICPYDGIEFSDTNYEVLAVKSLPL